MGPDPKLQAIGSRANVSVYPCKPPYYISAGGIVVLKFIIARALKRATTVYLLHAPPSTKEEKYTKALSGDGVISRGAVLVMSSIHCLHGVWD